MKTTKMLFICFNLLMVFCLIFYSGEIYAQSNENNISKCLDVIKNSLNKKEIRIENRRSRTLAYSWLLSQEFKEKNTEIGSSMAVIWEGIPIKGEYNYNNFSQFKKNVGTINLNTEDKSEEIFFLKEILNDNAVEMLETCMSGGAKGGFLATKLERIERSLVVLKIEFKGTDSNNFIKRLNCDNIKNLKKVNPISDLRKQTITMERINPNRTATIRFFGNDRLGNSMQSFVIIPPDNSIDYELVQLQNLFFLGSDQIPFDSDWIQNPLNPVCHYLSRGHLTPDDLRINKTSINYRFRTTISASHRDCRCSGPPASNCGFVDYGAESCTTAYKADLQITNDKGNKKVKVINDRFENGDCIHSFGLDKKVKGLFSVKNDSPIN